MAFGSETIRERCIEQARVSMSASLLRLSNVTKSFGAVRALKGVSFDLIAGEVHGLEKPASTRRVRWGDRRVRAVELLKRVGGNISPDAEVRDLSMPEQQLVEIARALGAGARMLIMDEPTASLTAREVDLLLGLVNDLRSQGVSIIYISH